MASGMSSSRTPEIDHVYDLIVVGAGVVGSATAWAAAKDGYSVLLLEQGKFGHGEGSSAGESRIIRLTYPEPHYANIMPRAFELWRTVRASGGDDDILVETGGLDFGPKDGKEFQTLLETCRTCGVDFEHLDDAALRSRFPGMTLPEGHECIYSAGSGILRASRCVVALRRLAREAGCVEKDMTTVLATREGASSTKQLAEVDTRDGTYRARAVVLACGGWAPAILKRDFGITIPRRRLQPYATGVSYWKLRPEWVGKFNAKNLGPVIDYDPDFYMYGMGALEHPGWVKMCLHVVCTEDFAIDDMDNVQKRAEELGNKFRAKTEQVVSTWLKRHFQEGVFEEPLKICHFEPCVYTMTPTEDFVLDSVGSADAGAGRVVLISACSGHGFKTAPVMGSAAAALALAGAGAAATELRLGSSEAMESIFGLRTLLSDAGDVGAGPLMGAKADVPPSKL
eukprot:TRINITY_DN111211_c0_g1_i1.p1 TRINITY_DN111211_c0_g1~~TRINITY_DN111211_c0_g1_i1.p1  ORF type:complete len:454 (-),score=51.79 TRINITY_DN111211_c0_g1_i1:48-1409(-)